MASEVAPQSANVEVEEENKAELSDRCSEIVVDSKDQNTQEEAPMRADDSAPTIAAQWDEETLMTDADQPLIEFPRAMSGYAPSAVEEYVLLANARAELMQQQIEQQIAMNAHLKDEKARMSAELEAARQQIETPEDEALTASVIPQTRDGAEESTPEADIAPQTPLEAEETEQKADIAPQSANVEVEVEEENTAELSDRCSEIVVDSKDQNTQEEAPMRADAIAPATTAQWNEETFMTNTTLTQTELPNAPGGYAPSAVEEYVRLANARVELMQRRIEQQTAMNVRLMDEKDRMSAELESARLQVASSLENEVMIASATLLTEQRPRPGRAGIGSGTQRSARGSRADTDAGASRCRPFDGAGKRAGGSASMMRLRGRRAPASAGHSGGTRQCPRGSRADAGAGEN